MDNLDLNSNYMKMSSAILEINPIFLIEGKIENV